MKKFFYIILYFTILGGNTYTTPQVNQAITYFPLKTGNIWVYRCSAYGNPQYGCGCILKKYRFQIIGTVERNSKTYFVFQRTATEYQCMSCYEPPIPDTVRIDSTSGNIYKYSVTGCSYSPFEILLDSLNARLNDTVWSNCGLSQWRYRCMDTSNQVVFGVSRKTKSFNELQFESSYGRSFAQGIGMISAGMSRVFCYQNSSSLIGCVLDGVFYGDTSMIVGITPISTEVPTDFSLSQNYPNPFNPTTKIQFSVPSSQFVVIKIFDVTGREVTVLVNEELKPRTYEVEFDGSNFASGVYYYTLQTETFKETKRMVIIK